MVNSKIFEIKSDGTTGVKLAQGWSVDNGTTQPILVIFSLQIYEEIYVFFITSVWKFHKRLNIMPNSPIVGDSHLSSKA